MFPKVFHSCLLTLLVNPIVYPGSAHVQTFLLDPRRYSNHTNSLIKRQKVVDLSTEDKLFLVNNSTWVTQPTILSLLLIYDMPELTYMRQEIDIYSDFLFLCFTYRSVMH